MEISELKSKLICPITDKIFLNPVIGEDGKTYEKDKYNFKSSINYTVKSLINSLYEAGHISLKEIYRPKLNTFQFFDSNIEIIDNQTLFHLKNIFEVSDFSVNELLVILPKNIEVTLENLIKFYLIVIKYANDDFTLEENIFKVFKLKYHMLDYNIINFSYDEFIEMFFGDVSKFFSINIIYNMKGTSLSKNFYNKYNQQLKEFFNNEETFFDIKQLIVQRNYNYKLTLFLLQNYIKRFSLKQLQKILLQLNYDMYYEKENIDILIELYKVEALKIKIDSNPIYKTILNNKYRKFSIALNCENNQLEILPLHPYENHVDTFVHSIGLLDRSKNLIFGVQDFNEILISQQERVKINENTGTNFPIDKEYKDFYLTSISFPII